MLIVAIAWIYVVGLMALTESGVLLGIMTFFGYCVLPLSLLFYVTGSGRRRRRNAARAAAPGGAASAVPIDDGASSRSIE